LKTVYNYLSKHSGKIRIKKEHGKQFVHIEDFKKVFYKNSKAVYNDIQNVQSNTVGTQVEKYFES